MDTHQFLEQLEGEPEHYTVDRIEGKTAVLTGPKGEVKNLPLGSLPAGTSAGSVLRREGKAFVHDDEERERRMSEAGKTLRKLRKRDPGGDVAL